MKHLTIPGDIINDMHAAASRAAQAARSAHVAYRTDVEKINTDVPGTVPLPAAEKFKRSQDAKVKHRAAFPPDPELRTHANALTEVRRALDLDELVSSARFLPPIAAGADALTADMRVIASATIRDGYLRKLQRMNVTRLAEEASRAARAAGSDPTSNDALARLDAIREVADAKQGEGWAPARAAVGAALSHVESQWTERRELLGRIDEAEGLIDEAQTYGSSIVDGKDSSRLAFFRHRAKLAA